MNIERVLIDGGGDTLMLLPRSFFYIAFFCVAQRKGFFVGVSGARGSGARGKEIVLIFIQLELMNWKT